MTALQLAERCERATGPDRDLDRDIGFEIADKEYLWALSGMNAQRPLFTEADLRKSVMAHPCEYPINAAYTASLDAAMALVPYGLGFSICPHSVLLTRSIDDVGVMARGNTTALALCAAALKARAASRIEARSDETAKTGSAEGESLTTEGGDAHD